ncbi:hypothetical protein D3C81_2049260 [compost metagenome]
MGGQIISNFFCCDGKLLLTQPNFLRQMNALTQIAFKVPEIVQNPFSLFRLNPLQGIIHPVHADIPVLVHHMIMFGHIGRLPLSKNRVSHYLTSRIRGEPPAGSS